MTQTIEKKMEVIVETKLETEINQSLAIIQNPEDKMMLLSKYKAYFDQLKAYEDTADSIIVNDVTDTEAMKIAGTARKELVKVRTGADKLRKELKANSLNYGRGVDAVYNVIETKTKAIEETLREKEEFKKRIKEAERAEKIRFRHQTLLQNGIDPELYNIELGTDEQFEHLVKTSIIARDAEKARLEAEEKAKIEAERIAKETEEKARIEREENEKKIREENEKLRLEAQEREKVITAEREAREVEAKKEREAQEEILRKERAEREKIEAELQAKKEEERQAELNKKINLEMLSRSEDKEKILNLSSQLKAISFFELKSGYANTLQSKIQQNITAMILCLDNYKEN